MLELDCHLTKDHQVVVHHDFSINRTTAEDGFIRDIAYDVSVSILNPKTTTDEKHFLFRTYQELARPYSCIMTHVREQMIF